MTRIGDTYWFIIFLTLLFVCMFDVLWLTVCTPFPLALFPTSGDFNDKDFAAAAAAVQTFPALQHIALQSQSVDEQNSSVGNENDVTPTTGILVNIVLIGAMLQFLPTYS